MAYIFLDESGDPGFNFKKKRTSKFFIVTILFVEQKRLVEKIIRDVHAGLRKKYKIRASVLHAAKEESVNITRVCRGLVEKHCKPIIVEENILYKWQNLMRYLRATLRKPTHEDLPVNFSIY